MSTRNAFAFAPATKQALKARIAIEGVSGAGKTWTALTIARGLVGPDGRIGLIDTERRKASLYSGLFRFDTLPLDRFSPEILIDALAAASDHDACILDSFSHFWMGVDGMLEQVDKAAKAKAGGNNFGGWKEMRPVERRMMDALLAFPGHLIVTMRSKSDYVLETNDRGKIAPRKVGMKAEQREGFEYEFDLVGTMDLDNTIVFSKSRCPQFQGEVITKPTLQVGSDLAAWLADGDDSGPTALDLRDQALAVHITLDELVELGRSAKASGHAAAVVIDSTGETVTLEDLIRARWREVNQEQQRAKAAAAAADDDAWQKPAAASVPETPMVNDKQHKAMHANWNSLGYAGEENRQNRLDVTGRIISREITSSSQLTEDEADTVITALKERVRKQKAEARA